MKKCANPKMDPRAFRFTTVDEDGPGPGAYGTRTTVGQKNRYPIIPNEPAYTAYPRLRFSDETESPGPVYNLTNLTCRGKTVAPKFSMGIKKVEKSETDSPGPAAYMLKADRGPKIKILLPIKDVDPNADIPGPNVYMLPSTLSRKRITLAKRIDEDIETKSPGPAGYKLVPLNRYKNRAPNFSLYKNYEDPLVADEMRSTTPGPQAYHPTLKYKYKEVPKFSFGMRRPEKFAPMVVCGDGPKKRK